ncbi:hypothetical protein MUS1_06460 [Marinomonas ushuaiensis DSM 15871]|uniref:Uncharacterized protein n=1 Tax=Marinomonas ushuaiensis DSM 15871 TaxID=1122207 RepID=X7E0P2_9GAMM|nr:hypothetical protein [Marinomonas ushuaiensis]ETX09654.1 hypothetical protein MUS1_06460 [Marinomonas ushuaiensis DSM 15871]
MKLMNAYFVAVYSSQKCTLFDSSDVDGMVICHPQNQDISPDSIQLESIQKDISFKDIPLNDDTFHRPIFNNRAGSAKIIVVIPDSWISVTQHKIDHLVPISLAPLAALSYATETTFTAPEALMFNYRQVVLDRNQTQLTVFACSNEWANQLCSPFKMLGASCLLMSQTQWADASVRNTSWSSLRKHALSIYQPDKEKNTKTKRLWFILVLLSLLVHSGAYVYFWNLQQQTEIALIDRQKTLTLISEWESDQVNSPFAESILGLIQALPTSVRLMQFDAGFDQAFLQVTLPQRELATLIERWREGDSSLQFEWEQLTADKPSGFNSEVIDASISISKN